MMNFPLRRTTAGLNVPADSQVVPCGERIGSFVARFHTPKGKSVAGAANASDAARSNSTMRFLGFRTCMISNSSLCELVSLLRVELHGADDAFAFFDDDHLVRLDVLQGFHQPAGPANLEHVNPVRFADAEVDAEIVLRKISAAAAHFVNLRVRIFFAGEMRDAFDARTDAAAIGFCSDGFDLDPIVAAAQEDVRPAVVVHVEKAAAPAEILRVFAETALVRAVLEIRAAEIVVERGRISGEICFDEIKIAIEIVIGGGDAHAGLGLAVGAEGAARFKGDVDKRSVLFVLIQRAGGGVVGNVNVRPAIVVEIGGGQGAGGGGGGP